MLLELFFLRIFRSFHFFEYKVRGFRPENETRQQEKNEQKYALIEEVHLI